MPEITLTSENFEQEVLQSPLPVLVDFWASWCGPCRMLAPTLEALAEEREGSARIGKVNVDEQMELAVQYRIASVPTILIFKNGQITRTSVGVVSKTKLEEMLDQ